MSAPSLIARLGLDPAEFKRGLLASEDGLKKLQQDAKVTAAEIAFLERAMAGNGTAQQVAKHAELQKALRATQAEATATARQLAAMEAVKPSSGGHGGGDSRSGTQEATHSVRSIFDMVGAGQSFSQAAALAMPRLLQAAGKGLGTIIGIQAGAAIIKGVGEAMERAREARKEFTQSMSGGGLGTTSESGLRRNIDELTAAREKLTVDPGKWERLDVQAASYLKSGWRKLTGQKTDSEENDDKIEALEQRRIHLSEELARRKEETLALDKRAATEGEDAVAIDREKLALREKIRAVEDDKNLDATAQAKLIDLLKEESKLREEHIKQAQTMKAAESDAKAADATDRTNGQDTASSKAANAYIAALTKRDALPEGSREWKDADTEVKNRGADVQSTQQEQAVKDAQRKEAARLAEMTGSQAQKERERLTSEKDAIARQLDPNSGEYERNADKRKDLKVQQTQNSASLRALDRSDVQRGFQRRENDISANSELGPDGQIKTIDARLALLADRQKDNDTHEKDVDVASKLTAEAAELARKKEDIRASERDSLATMKEQTTAIGDQGFALDAEEKKERIRQKTRDDVQKMRDKGAPADQIAERQRQGAAQENQADVSEVLMTPAQKLQREEANRAHRRAQGVVESRKRLEASYAADGTSRMHLPDLRPDINAAAANAGKSDVKDVSALIPILQQIADNTDGLDDLSFKTR